MTCPKPCIRSLPELGTELSPFTAQVCTLSTEAHCLFTSKPEYEKAAFAKADFHSVARISLSSLDTWLNLKETEIFC